MWGRKEDTQDPADAVTPPTPSAPGPEPAAPPVSTGSPAGAQIGKSLKIKGEIAGNEDLYIDGEVEGRITLEGNNLTVGPNGKVSAEVAAHSITILGHLEGNVRAEDRMEIRRTGSLEGDLVAARIAIEEDAVFRGSIDIVKPAAKGETAAPAAGTKAPAERPKETARPSSPGRPSGPTS
jgi:cytoskeletal protein CcmA (bactofilin family)